MWGDVNMAFHYTPVWCLFLDQNSLRCLTQLTVNDSLKSMYLYTDPIAKGDVDNKVLKI